MKKRKKSQKPQKPHIKLILFDIGEVLSLGPQPIFFKSSEYNKEVHQIMSKKFKMSLKKWFLLLEETKKESNEKMISKTHTKLLSKKLGLKISDLEKLWFKTYNKAFHENKELYSYAFKLKKKGYKIGILSNQWYMSKKALVTPKSKKFDIMIISCDVGVKKPDKQIYLHLLKKIKIPPKNIVFIDNLQRNLDPAKKLGMHTILFKNNQQTLKELKKLGVEI